MAQVIVEVERCPFCGTSIKGYGEPISGGGWLIQCECGGEMSGETQIETINAWNRRTAAKQSRHQSDRK